MPDLRVVSWNSDGESIVKRNALIDFLSTIVGRYPTYPHVDVIVIQEANNNAGGSIFNYLNGLNGWNVTHVPEMINGGGRAYICAVRQGAAIVNQALTLYRYAQDQDVVDIRNNCAKSGLFFNDLAFRRAPAFTSLSVGQVTVLLITWHAPRQVTALPLFPNIPNGALFDAYYALEYSALLRNPIQVINNDPVITIIAGDLNTTCDGLNNNYLVTAGEYGPIIPDFNGLSKHLDHILANRHAKVLDQCHREGHSVHAMISGRVNW